MPRNISCVGIAQKSSRPLASASFTSAGVMCDGAHDGSGRARVDVNWIAMVVRSFSVERPTGLARLVTCRVTRPKVHGLSCTYLICRPPRLFPNGMQLSKLLGTAAASVQLCINGCRALTEEKRVNMNYGEQIAARNDQEGPVAHSSTGPGVPASN